MAENKGTTKKDAKKKSHTGSKVVGAAVLLALLGGGGYFGLGIGNPNGGALPINQPTAAETTVAREQEAQAPAPPETTVEVTEEATELIITVKGTEILYQGKTVTLTELETALLSDYKSGKTVKLVDDKAIESVYSDVSALLTKLNIPLDK